MDDICKYLLINIRRKSSIGLLDRYVPVNIDLSVDIDDDGLTVDDVAVAPTSSPESFLFSARLMAGRLQVFFDRDCMSTNSFSVTSIDD